MPNYISAMKNKKLLKHINEDLEKRAQKVGLRKNSASQFGKQQVGTAKSEATPHTLTHQKAFKMLGRSATGVGGAKFDLPIVQGPYSSFRQRSDTINSNTFEETFIGNLHFQQSVFPPSVA